MKLKFSYNLEFQCLVISEIIFALIYVRVTLYRHNMSVCFYCSVCVISPVAVFYFTQRCHTVTVPEGAVGVRMWVFCFIYTSFELLIMVMMLCVTDCLWRCKRAHRSPGDTAWVSTWGGKDQGVDRSNGSKLIFQ